jgi:hypothetical protein
VNQKLFVDTMVFLHFRPLGELELASRVQSETVTLVVPRITLRELDKHKSIHSNRKVRDRARRVLKDLETAISDGAPLNGGISVEYFPAHPKDQLESRNLNPEWADDILVASIIAYRDATSTTNITFISQDTGPRLTCRHHGIATLQLDDSVALPEDSDDTERENRALQQQVQGLQNALPRLEAVFEGSDKPRNVARITLRVHPELDEQKLAEFMERIRKAFPIKTAPGALPSNHPLAESLNNTLKMMAQLELNAIGGEQIREYNSKLDKFYVKAESYFRARHEFQELTSRTFSFVVEICNTGTAPADDVDVLLRFPDGFRLLSEDHLPSEPEPPHPPKEPLDTFNHFRSDLSSVHSLITQAPPFPFIDRTSSFCIKKHNSYDVTDHFPRIKHGIPATLPKMYIEFPSLSEATSFKCTYELRPANLTDPVTGELHFVIEREGD